MSYILHASMNLLRPPRGIWLAFAVSASACGDVDSSGPASSDPPNLLLISIDTTRADALGCYGSDRGATPFLDSLAAQGMVFENAFSPVPLTLPAHTTLLSGSAPTRHGVRNNTGFQVTDAVPLLGEQLQEHGYRTFAVVASIVLAASSGLDQGFDVFDEGSLDPIEGPAERAAPEVAAKTRELLAGSAPWFGFVHFYDPHLPYSPPADLAPPPGAHPIDLYYAEIAAVDRAIQEIVTSLSDKDRGNTAIVVTSDHGEGLGEHYEVTHGHLLHDATQRVPLILMLPDRTPGRVPTLVTLADVGPTLLELAGVSPTELRDGESLLPLWQDPSAEREEWAYLETIAPFVQYGYAPLTGLRSPEWKLVKGARSYLYDLGQDPQENRDVAAEKPGVLQKLERRLEQWEQQRSEPGGSRTLSPEERASFEALGYVSHGGDLADAERSSLADPYGQPLSLFHLSEALRLVRAAQPQTAIVAARHALRLAPQCFASWEYLGLCHEMLGEHDKALHSYQQALKRRPDSGELMTRVGESALKAGRPELAEEPLVRATQQDGAPVRSYFLLAKLHRDQQSPEEATRVLQALLQRPNLSRADRARAEELLQRQKPEDS